MKNENTNQIFIDKFFVPANAKAEFIQRMNINRKFISKLPGFIRDDVYARNNENGNMICITVAVWENQDALNKAKATVQAEYKREGFDPAAMMERLNITMDRGVYEKLENTD